MRGELMKYLLLLCVLLTGCATRAPADDAAFVEVYSEPSPLIAEEVQQTIDAVKLDFEPVADPISSDPCNCKPLCQCTQNQCNAAGCNPAANVTAKKAVSQPKACVGFNCRPRIFGGLFRR
jgi:hypothetical protein